MKQTLLFIAALFLSAGSFGQNLVNNGGFETWDDETTPTSWTHVENVTQETSIVHTGTYSAKHTGGTKDLGQFVPLVGGKSYTISIWYYTVQADETDSRIWAKWADSEKTYIADAATESQLQGPDNGYLPIFGQWAEYRTTVAAPANAAFLYLEVRTYSGAFTYWDDFSVIEDEATEVEQRKVNSFSVYPNPFSTDLNINGLEITSVELVNLAGQVMLQTEANNINRVKVPTGELTKGIYLVKIRDINGNEKTQKVIKK